MSSADITDNIRLGEECDFYYVDEHSARKSVYRALTNNRFNLSFNNLTGDSAFIFNSLQGLQGVLMKLTLPDSGTLAWASGYAVSSGWGAAAINRLTYRIGNLPEQYQTGLQVLVQNMIDQDNQSAKDSLYALAGLPLVPAAAGGTNPAGDFAPGSVKLDAFVPLNFPWYVATSRGTMRPLPTDMLMSPVIVRCQLNPLSSILSAITGIAAPSSLQTTWSQGSLRFRQVMMERQDDLLKNRTSASAVYSFPLKYYAQLAQTTSIPAAQSVSTNTYNLVGFRNGRVKKVVLWAQDNAVLSNALTRNPNEFATLNDVQLTYNGDIYYQTTGQEHLAWSLMSATSPPLFANQSLVPNASPPTAFSLNSQASSSYVVIDLAQVEDQAHQATTAIGGLKVDNAVINLQLSIAGADGSKNYTLYAVYLYECTALFHQGSCDFIW